MTRFVLASASPSRSAVLRAAGVDPIVVVSGVDEDTLRASLGPGPTPARVVMALARAKAMDVLDDPLVPADCVVVGCDSMLLLGGRLEGKPVTIEAARARWRRQRGRHGVLLTGHAVVRVVGGEPVGEAVDVAETAVHFGSPTDADLDAYLGTGEPLGCAGAFTLEALGGWFIDRIEGDPSSVIGIGLPLLRRLLGRFDIGTAALWRDNPLP